MHKYFEVGQKAYLDIGFANCSIVEVVRQTPNRLYSTVKSLESAATWDVMTYRLTPQNEN